MDKDRYNHYDQSDRFTDDSPCDPDGNADLLLRYPDPLAHAEEYQPAAFQCTKPGREPKA